MMQDYSKEQFVYLTTTGRKTGLPREIEIWFVERDGCLYILAERGRNANWVRNILANPFVSVRLGGRRWRATGRVVEPDTDSALHSDVQDLARTKYGWGEGMPVEFRLGQEGHD
jgi:deazaflavin-dependent oxidoreductase (nitroreductase family)